MKPIGRHSASGLSLLLPACARFLELGRPGCERQAVLEAGADIPEVGQRRAIGRNRQRLLPAPAAAARACPRRARRLPVLSGGAAGAAGVGGGACGAAGAGAAPGAGGAPCPGWPCPLPRSPASGRGQGLATAPAVHPESGQVRLAVRRPRCRRVQIDRAVRILGLRLWARTPPTERRSMARGRRQFLSNQLRTSNVFMSASGVGRDRAIDGRRSEARNVAHPWCPRCP